MRAIGLTLAAIRGIERWGTTEMVDAAFSGFAALPESTSGEAWWDVLKVSRHADRETIEAVWRQLAKTHHPDAGGDPEMFRRIANAYGQATAVGRI